MLFSEVGFRATWTDDSADAKRKTRRDPILYQPEIGFNLVSQFQRHQFDVKGEVRPIGIEDGEVRSLDGKAEANLRIDIDHAHRIFALAATDIRNEENLEDDFLSGKIGRSSVARTKAEVGLARHAGRIDSAVGARYIRWDYADLVTSDGLQIDQSAQNYSLLQPFLRLGMTLSPGYRVFGEIAGRLQENRGDGNIDRDARGVEASVGAEFELSPVIRMMVRAGYVSQDYLQPGLVDIGAMIWQGRLEWLVTPLLTLSLNTAREVQSTGFGDASGRLLSSYTMRADYEMWRNLLVSAEVGLKLPEYIGEDRDDTIWMGRLGAEYMLGKHWLVTLNYEHQSQTSNLPGLERTLDRVGLGVKYRY